MDLGRPPGPPSPSPRSYFNRGFLTLLEHGAETAACPPHITLQGVEPLLGPQTAGVAMGLVLARGMGVRVGG